MSDYAVLALMVTMLPIYIAIISIAQDIGRIRKEMQRRRDENARR